MQSEMKSSYNGEFSQGPTPHTSSPTHSKGTSFLWILLVFGSVADRQPLPNVGHDPEVPSRRLESI